MTNPLFIVIVGIDGSGKSTLVESLGRRGLRVRTWRDLQRIPAAAPFVPVKPILSRSAASPLFRAVFIGGYLAAEYDYLVKPCLEAGHSVILDSYYFKSLAKETFYMVSHPILAEICAALPKPDVVIYLDVDPTIAARRKKHFTPYEYNVSPELDDIVQFNRRISDIMQELISDIPKVIIDANSPANELESSVISGLEELGVIPASGKPWSGSMES